MEHDVDQAFVNERLESLWGSQRRVSRACSHYVYECERVTWGANQGA